MRWDGWTYGQTDGWMKRCAWQGDGSGVGFVLGVLRASHGYLFTL